MSLLNKAISFASGTGWVDQEELGKQLDAQKADIDRELYERGTWSAETYAVVQQRAAASATQDYKKEVGAAFAEGAAEGAANIRNGIGATIDRVFSLIPWQLWILGVAVAFVWLGGPAFVKGKLKP